MIKSIDPNEEIKAAIAATAAAVKTGSTPQFSLIVDRITGKIMDLLSPDGGLDAVKNFLEEKVLKAPGSGEGRADWFGDSVAEILAKGIIERMDWKGELFPEGYPGRSK